MVSLELVCVQGESDAIDWPCNMMPCWEVIVPLEWGTLNVEAESK